MGDSAFPRLQTSVRRGTSLVYSAPRAALLRCRHSCFAGLRSRTGDPCRSSKPRSEGEPALFTLLRELPRQGASEAVAPATKVVLVARVGPLSLGQKGSQPCLLCSESCGAKVPVKPLHRPQESRGDPVVPPLGIFCSLSDQNLSESVASSRSLRFD
ncbi:uncharacterized protein LOC100404308 [Callithrix jacchus]